MSSTFFALETGIRALATNQTALEVVGNNTANINTPGYSRQVVQFDETSPYTLPSAEHTSPGQLGTGVTIASINRIRDQFLDARVNAASSEQGALNNLRDVLGQVEAAFNEPSGAGLGNALTNFFNTFSDLSADPQNGAIRATVLNSGQALVSQFHSIANVLNQINPPINAKVTSEVGQANDIARQIATLNGQISLSIATGDQPNDLEDKRGQLISQLSSIVSVQTLATTDPATGKPTGNINITVGGYSLVQNSTTNNLPTTVATTNGQISLQGGGNDIPIASGDLYGLIKASTLVTGYQGDLNTLAANVISAVNTIHSAGYGLDGQTNRAFFTGTDAGSIAVSSLVATNTDAIAAATAPAPGQPFAPGNGDTARALAALTSQPVIGSFTLDGYYNAKVALIGADSQAYQAQAENQQKVSNLLSNQQASVSGVNLDEELTRLLQYQRSYQAAARFISTADTFLDRVINQLGAGRG